MRQDTTLVAAGLAAMLAGAAPGRADPPLAYPPAERGPQLDEYHGITVPDPYRWMEDIDSAQTRAWVEAEAKLGDAYLSSMPERAAVAAELRKVWNFERWTPPEHHGAYWYFTHNDGLQNQPVVFVAPTLDAPPRLLLDPNPLSAAGTTALNQYAVSDDGRLFAYALSEAGSDWQVWRVRDVETGKDLPDELHWSKFGGGSWRKDGSGFYYTAYDPPAPGQTFKAANQYEKLYFHRLGTPQSADPLVYTRIDAPDWDVSGEVTEDGSYLVVRASKGTDIRNTLLVQDLAAPGAPLRPVIPEPTYSAAFIGNVGTTFYVLTNADAPHYRVVALDLDHPEPKAWRTVVAETEDTLVGATLVGGQFVANYLHDAHALVRRYALDGHGLGEVALPGLGSVAGFDGRIGDHETCFRFASYATPPAVFRLDTESGRATLWHQSAPAGFDPGRFAVRQVFYKSKDGTRVPMFIAARKGVQLDAGNPTILYGYGGFNLPQEPNFLPQVAAWLELGGVFALANIRGGAEYGDAWHEAGMKTRKQNVFDDFAAAAQYLIRERWTRPARLAIHGRSNGGLLIGAVEEQHPELFAAAIPQVGVMDMLRFRDFTVGRGWESDYGSVDNPDELKAMLDYSPYQNAKPGVDYPATLILTGDHDDRVFPAHSFKFAAAMQNDDPHGNPIILRIDRDAGHGATGKPTTKLIDEFADIYGFIRHAFAAAK